MKNRLRKITVGDVNFLWIIGYGDGRIGWQSSQINDDSIILKLWVEGYKKTPWINIKYRHHNFWTYFGDLVAASKDEETQKRANAYFNFKPLTPQNVKEIIDQAMLFFTDRYGDKLFNKNANENFDYIDGKLIHLE